MWNWRHISVLLLDGREWLASRPRGRICCITSGLQNVKKREMCFSYRESNPGIPASSPTLNQLISSGSPSLHRQRLSTEATSLFTPIQPCSSWSTDARYSSVFRTCFLRVGLLNSAAKTQYRKSRKGCCPLAKYRRHWEATAVPVVTIFHTWKRFSSYILFHLFIVFVMWRAISMATDGLMLLFIHVHQALVFSSRLKFLFRVFEYSRAFLRNWDGSLVFMYFADVRRCCR
jgi:hypothetical protein